MYVFQKVNLRMQKDRAEQRKTLFAKQDIQRRLVNLKPRLEQFGEYQEDRPAAQRKKVKIVAELDQFLKLISPEARREIFGEKSNKEIREEVKSTEEHWTSVADSLDARIADEIVKMVKGAAARLQASKIKYMHRTPKSAAIKRYFSKRELPPCLLDEVEI
jgi:hypothetical protein